MFHPSVRLILWGAATVYAQALDGIPLATVAAVVLAVTAVVAPRRLYELLRRARWLLLSIGLLFACATPGEALIAALGPAAPTYEGVQLAGTHLGRLAVVLALLAALLRFTQPEELVSALHGLLRPLAVLGLPRDRIALRLMLVLRYVDEQAGLQRRTSWRQWLSPPAEVSDAPMSIRVHVLRSADIAVLTGLLAASLFALSR